VHVTRWRSDRFAFGSYAYSPAHRDGEQESTPLDFLELSRTLWGRVFWAGEHTEVDSYASAHGAWLSGDRKAGKFYVISLDGLIACEQACFTARLLTSSRCSRCMYK
jgi:hypothetical protein